MTTSIQIDPTRLAAWERVARQDGLLTALTAIADMKVNETTDHAQLSALCVAIARTAIAKATT